MCKRLEQKITATIVIKFKPQIKLVLIIIYHKSYILDYKRHLHQFPFSWWDGLARTGRWMSRPWSADLHDFGIGFWAVYSMIFWLSYFVDISGPDKF